MDSGSSVAVCTKSPQAANQACPLSTCATFCWWPSRVQTQTHTKTQTSASTNTENSSQKFRIGHSQRKTVQNYLTFWNLLFVSQKQKVLLRRWCIKIWSILKTRGKFLEGRIKWNGQLGMFESAPGSLIRLDHCCPPQLQRRSNFWTN